MSGVRQTTTTVECDIELQTFQGEFFKISCMRQYKLCSSALLDEHVCAKTLHDVALSVEANVNNSVINEHLTVMISVRSLAYQITSTNLYLLFLHRLVI